MGVVLVHTSCVPSIDIPPSPDLGPVLAAFDDPTADVRVEIMSEYGDIIAQVDQELTVSNLARQFLDIIDSVRAAIDGATDDEGNLSVGGVVAPAPDGLVTIQHVCTGWDPTQAEPDEATNGSIELQMPIVGGRLGPIVWGVAAQCLYLVNVGGQQIQASYDGDIAVHFGDLIDSSQELRKLTTTFLVEGSLGLAGAIRPITQSFRVREGGGVEILVELADAETFVYFLGLDQVIEGIRDRTGTFACSLEERECAKDSEPFSW